MSRLGDPQCHDDLLNYRLKRLFTLGGAPAVRLCEGQYGISRMQWRLVAALVEHGAMSPMELVEFTGLEQARVSRQANELQQKGLVARRVAREPGRRWELSATQAGHQLYARLFPQLAGINRRLVAALTEQEAIALELALDKLTARAREILQEGDAVPVKTDRRLGGSRRFWTGLRP
jgi:DNA-binding MarR family transcriptional regulator